MNNRGIELVNIAPYIVNKNNLTDLAEKANVHAECAEKLIMELRAEKNNHRRQPKPPAPEGGISLMAAERKYGINHGTLSRWSNKGLVPILLRTGNELYMDEASLASLIKAYKENPGQGKQTVKQIIKTP